MLDKRITFAYAVERGAMLFGIAAKMTAGLAEGLEHMIGQSVPRTWELLSRQTFLQRGLTDCAAAQAPHWPIRT